jgi:hypothetical protein
MRINQKSVRLNKTSTKSGSGGGGSGGGGGGGSGGGGSVSSEKATLNTTNDAAEHRRTNNTPNTAADDVVLFNSPIDPCFLQLGEQCGVSSLVLLSRSFLVFFVFSFLQLGCAACC